MWTDKRSDIFEEMLQFEIYNLKYAQRVLQIEDAQ